MAAEKKKPDTKKSRDKNMDGDIAKSKTESPPAAEKKESGKKTNSKKTNNKKTTKKEALSNSSSPTLKKNGALDDIQQQQAQSQTATENKFAKKARASNLTSAGKNPKKPKIKELKLSVPRGGQLIRYFNLTPALPTDAGRGDWLFTQMGSNKDIENLRVEFQLNPSPLERALERAVLVVRMAQDPKAKGTWRFALGGVATDHGDADPDNDVTVEIIDNGFTLIAYVQVLENSEEYIPFGFVASFTDEATGAVSIYESQDPGIQPVRPPKP